jgi:hypothetical protein
MANMAWYSISPCVCDTDANQYLLELAILVRVYSATVYTYDELYLNFGADINLLLKKEEFIEVFRRK